MEGLKEIIARYDHIKSMWDEEIDDLLFEGEGSLERVIKLKSKIDILNRILNDLKAL